MPSPAALFGAIFFGAVGMAFFVHGKRVGSLKPILVGIALMAFPYFVSGGWATLGIGAALTAAGFVFRD